jgi:hypothetical protein
MFIQPPLVRRFSTALAVKSLLFPVTALTIRDELRKHEDRQKMLLLLVQMLQQVCDESSAPVADGATNHADAAPVL